MMDKELFDFHVHCGQYEDVYFYPYKVIDILSECDIRGAYISSTTSCMNWNNPYEKKLIINHIKDEIQEIVQHSALRKFDAKPLCWINPLRLLEGDSISGIYEEANYCGFKIHPRAHEWNLKNNQICFFIDNICQYAQQKNIPIWIHTGDCDYELPEKFEKWYRMFPDVKFVMAHCKNPKSVLPLFEVYGNVFGDISFNNITSFREIEEMGFSDKIFWGTDFPITILNAGIDFNNESECAAHYRQIMKYWKQDISKMRNQIFP